MLDFEETTTNKLLLPVKNSGSSIPVTVITGAEEGETVLVSAGIHSREYTGMQASINLAARLKPESIRGRIIIAHCCNYEGFVRHSNDEVPSDGKNLNKVFPGSETGSEAQRIAAAVTGLVNESDYIIDLHCGGSYEALTPHAYFQCMADKNIVAKSIELSAHAHMPYTVGADGTTGLYSSSALAGKPSVLVERGQYSVWTQTDADAYMADVMNMLRFLQVLDDGKNPVRHEQKVLMNAFYEKAEATGCWYPEKAPGQLIEKGEKLGEIRSFFGEVLETAFAKANGVVLYETSALAITEGEPMIAYGEI